MALLLEDQRYMPLPPFSIVKPLKFTLSTDILTTSQKNFSIDDSSIFVFPDKVNGFIYNNVFKVYFAIDENCVISACPIYSRLDGYSSLALIHRHRALNQ